MTAILHYVDNCFTVWKQMFPNCKLISAHYVLFHKCREFFQYVFIHSVIFHQNIFRKNRKLGKSAISYLAQNRKKHG